MRKHRVWQDLPQVTPNPSTKMIVTDNNGQYLGYASAADLGIELDTNGLATDASVQAVSASVAALSASIGVSGSYSTQNIFHATSNGLGTNFQVGDDAWIGDVNYTNTLQVSGQQDNTKGYIKFGSGSATPIIGTSGPNHLNIVNIPVYSNNTAAIAGGLVAGDIYRNGDNLGIVH